MNMKRICRVCGRKVAYDAPPEQVLCDECLAYEARVEIDPTIPIAERTGDIHRDGLD
jgi:NMD protein affecting ribosome stability and mRNA decay